MLSWTPAPYLRKKEPSFCIFVLENIQAELQNEYFGKSTSTHGNHLIFWNTNKVFSSVSELYTVKHLVLPNKITVQQFQLYQSLCELAHSKPETIVRDCMCRKNGYISFCFLTQVLSKKLLSRSVRIPMKRGLLSFFLHHVHRVYWFCA